MRSILLSFYNSFITKIFEVIGIFYTRKEWVGFRASLDKFSDDFMVERNQPELDK